MIGMLALTVDDVQDVGAGRLSPQLLELLRASQSSKRRLLLAAARAETARHSSVDDAVALLEAADRRAPDAVSDIIARPFTNVWAVGCLRGSGDTCAPPFLSAMAAATAVQAGLAFELPVPAPDGVAFLPGLGAARVGSGPAVVRSDGGTVHIVGTQDSVRIGADAGWWPSREADLGGEPGWRLTVEDLDPYRNCFGHRPADRMSDRKWSTVEGLLAATATLLDRDHPAHARVIRQSLRFLVPLALEPARSADLSAASQEAYGSVAVGLPDDAAALALLLIHEVHHMTLGAALDLVDLCEVGGAHHYAPWRPDPRPVGALLQGTYAHMGVTDFWRVHRHHAGPKQRQAEFEFAYWRSMTRLAIETLSRSGELTPIGIRFVMAMAETVDPWADERVSPEVVRAVEEAGESNAVRWKLRNLQP